MKAFTLTALAVALSASQWALADANFNRIAAFPTYENIANADDRLVETSAEIIDVTGDGMTLVYTDSPLGVVGLIDIQDPRAPRPLGNIAMEGEPTSVVVIGQTAYVGVNTSESYVKPTGYVAVVDLDARQVVQTCALDGQPDALAKATDGSFISIAIENERDEDLNDGVIPQLPAGNLTRFNTVAGGLDCDSKSVTDLTGLAEIAGSDPEPEFVDVNGLGETVVTLQENNHLVVVDAAGKIVSHFSAGAIDLVDIDATDERGALIFNEAQQGVTREPDAVKWIDDNHFATANEGDYEGGSRGWTVFHKSGTVVYENGTAFERAIIQIGHYPDKRSDSKGVEPESILSATFGGTPMIFVGAERASVVGVYDATNPAAPVLTQLLPSGIGPEGYVAIPDRNLLVSANEVDLVEDGGARSHVMIYEYQPNTEAAYPTLTSAGAERLIGWGAISGMVAGDDGFVYAVNDSFYGYQPRVFKIDVSDTPARIVDAIDITRAGRPAQKLDLEGITTDGKGGFYLASEGRTDRLIPHAIYHINAKGEIKAEIPFPAELLAVETRFGSEGITRIGDTLWIAIQREWADDPKHHAKLVAYNLSTKTWGVAHYPKAEPTQGWVGLSEITAHGDSVYIVERDNQIGANAVNKTIYQVAQSDLVATPLSETPTVVNKTLVADLVPTLASFGGYVVDKVEGLAITADGEMFVSTDNDGVDDSSGETHFFSMGRVD